MSYNIENNLINILEELNHTKGVEGSIIIDSNGNVLVNVINGQVNVDIFGPMAQIIDSSSQRLLNSANLGEMSKVLLESKRGKSLFLQLDKVHLIILIEKKAHLGMVLRAAQKYSNPIISLSQQIPTKIVQDLETESQMNNTIEDIVPQEKLEEEFNESKELNEIPYKSLKISDVEESQNIDSIDSIIEEEHPPKDRIPSVKPPLSLPKLPLDVIIPETPEERSDLILKIYEYLFLAMAIGASKIMGVSPARGLTQKFLPFEDCKELLDGVEVKKNASIDFEIIKNNIKKIPIEKREEILIRDFSHMIEVITDNYGRVMGYDAFRGMISPEFKLIKSSFLYGMEELGIMKNMHPELKKLL